MYKFNRSAAPFRIIFSRAYVFTVCSPLLALVRCNLPRSRSVRIQHLSRLPSTVGRKSRSEVRACAYFVAGFHVRRTGLKRSLRCLAANVCCVQKSLKVRCTRCHLSHDFWRRQRKRTLRYFFPGVSPVHIYTY